MLVFVILLLIFVIFVQPQEFITAVKDWHLVDLVMGFVIIGMMFMAFTKKKIKFLNSQQNILMLLFWVAITLSTYSTTWFPYTKETFLEWGKIVIIYFSIINIITTEKKLKIIVWMIVLCSLFLALSGILQKYGFDITGVGVREEGRIRGIGIFDTNQLAYTLALFSPLVFALFLLTKNFLLKLILFIFFFLYYFAIYLTASRGGILCSILVLVLIPIVFFKNKSVKVFGLIAALIIFVYIFQIAPRLHTISGYQTDESAMRRILVWEDALWTLKKFPLFGIGKNLFVDNFHMAPHNSYIQVISELGLIGLFIWLSMFYFSLKNLRYIEHNSKSFENRVQKIFAKSFQISIFAFLFGSFFSGNAYYLTLYIMFALIVICQELTGPDIFKTKSLFSFKDVRNICFIGTAIIFLIYLLRSPQ